MSKEFTFFLHKFAPMNTELVIEAYSPKRKAEWDAFVDASRNATFLLRRDYMDYHSDRFKDCSLLISRGDKIIALLPASAHGREVRSHGGLTYGGLICGYGSDFSASTAVDLFNEIKAHYKSLGFTSMLYKPIPHIYHKYPAEEDLYALFRYCAQIEECNISSTIDLTCPIRFNSTRRWEIRKYSKTGITIREESDFNGFWNILTKLLQERHNTTPVHSLTEITHLHGLFPENIKLYCAYDAAGQLLAGTVIYLCEQCAHCQYIATTEAGRQQGALAIIYDHIINNCCEGMRYFDFGSSNEDHGRYLNEGLLAQKNGMGGRGIAYLMYRLEF